MSAFREAEASLVYIAVSHQPRLHSESLSQTNKQTNKRVISVDLKKDSGGREPWALKPEPHSLSFVPRFGFSFQRVKLDFSSYDPCTRMWCFTGSVDFLAASHCLITLITLVFSNSLCSPLQTCFYWMLSLWLTCLILTIPFPFNHDIMQVRWAGFQNACF